MKTLKNLLLAGFIGIGGMLAGCGGGGAATSTPGVSGGADDPTAAAVPTLSITLENAADNAALTTLSSGITGKLTATVKNAKGEVVPNALVTFATNSAVATFNPASGTTLTNEVGAANMLIVGQATSGASTATATAIWKEGGVDVSVTSSINYMVSAASPVALTVGAPVFGVNPLSAYGTTSVSVTITGTTSPLDVSFTSPCATSGKAVLTANVTTISGVAVASYRDNGCGNLDAITASIADGNSALSTLSVSPPSEGSIQFLSATPSIVSLKGTGSADLPEVSTVKFKILDTAGNPISRQVNFALSTKLGGIAFSNGTDNANATSDASTGEVQVVVNAGTLPTPLRVLATLAGTPIQTQSNQLNVTTGLPSQSNISLSATTFNIDGWRVDGITTTLTMRMSDSLSNPVPDGTAVNFIAEGGNVDGSCVTTNGTCSVTFTSKALRPTNGRILVLGYAVGVESFTDLNGNGTVDGANEMIDANGFNTDLPEAFVDYNENGTRDGAAEPYLDFDGNGSHRSVGDGKYNGILCTSGALICSDSKSLHVNRSIVIVLSDSAPVAADVFKEVATGSIDLEGCGKDSLGAITGGNSGMLKSFNIILRDFNNNPLPAGTTVTVTTSNGKVDAGASAVVPNTNVSYLVAPSDPAFVYRVTIKNDAAPNDSTCKDPTPAGILTVKIVPPVGPATEYSIVVNN